MAKDKLVPNTGKGLKRARASNGKRALGTEWAVQSKQRGRYLRRNEKRVAGLNRVRARVWVLASGVASLSEPLVCSGGLRKSLSLANALADFGPWLAGDGVAGVA